MELIAEIEKIVAGGKGLARPAAGKVIMTDLVLPGETVRIHTTREFPGYIDGDLVEVLSPSPRRIIPECGHYGICGGCDLQHADCAAQLEIKKDILAEAMVRAGLPLPESGVEDTLASPDQWGYRCRLRLKIDSSGRLGFFEKKSNRLVIVTNCPVATEQINAALAELQTSKCLQGAAEQCREIELQQSPVGHSITLVLHHGAENRISAQSVASIAACAHIDCIGSRTEHGFKQLIPEQPPVPLSQKISLPGHSTSCTLSWSAGCFSQVNSGQNEQLIRLICRLAGTVRNTTILDLYCGMGNFSIPLALQGAAVTGIEFNRESIGWAGRNADAAGAACSFFSADVPKSLHQLASDRQQVDTIILDPPRRGIGKAARLLPALNPEQIIYISCDPATQARDLAIVCRQGYSIDTLIPVDMFPQTHHIESVALLKKN